MNDIKMVIGDWEAFVGTILEETINASFDLDDFVQMDHICYRTVSTDNYKAKKSQLSNFGQLLAETNINGRSISTFRLKRPLMLDKWRIDAIELPAPKAGSEFPEGLEHAEFVIYDDKQSFLGKYKDKQFDLRAADRGVNPEIGYKLDKYAIKFHLLNLPTVIFIEKELGITDIKD